MLNTITEKQERMAFSVKEASRQTTLSPAYLRNAIRAGDLKVRRLGRRVLIMKEDLWSYLNKGDTN